MSGTTISTGTTDHAMSFDIHVALTMREVAAIVGLGGGYVNRTILEKTLASYITERLDAALAKFEADLNRPRHSAEIELTLPEEDSRDN